MIRASFLMLACLALAPLAWAEEVSPDGRVFVELLGPEQRPFRYEPYALRVRVTYDAAFFRAWGAPLFRRALDLPFQITLPWGDEEVVEADSGGVRIAFNDDVLAAQRLGEVVRGGRVFERIEIEQLREAAAVRTLDLPAPILRFAYATAFEEDLFGDRRAMDRHDVLVESEPLRIEVRPLPVEGRPEAFKDAVGRFTFDVEAIGRTRLVMRIGGEGNLETLTPPRVEDVPGLHVLGRLDRFEDGVRTLTWEVERAGAGDAFVPRTVFVYFDPTGEGAWREIAVGDVVPAPSPPAAPEATRPRPPLGLLLLLLAVAALAVVAVVARFLWRRGRPRVFPAQGSEPLPAWPEADPERALVAYAAAFLDQPVAAVVDAALMRHLVEAGMEAPLAARLAAAIEGLVASRYGGAAPDEAQIDELRRTLGAWKGSASGRIG